MQIRENHKYYIDEYKTFNEYIEEFVSVVKNKKIKSFIPLSALSWSENQDYALKVYDTDETNYLIFEDGIVLKFDYSCFSMIDIELTNLNTLKDSELEELRNRNNFDFDCYGVTITDYELNKFNDEYIINASSDTIRPEGGDYFKELIFHLSNGKKICICAENSESDGYCNIWMEDNNLKGIFNGQPHKAWWD